MQTIFKLIKFLVPFWLTSFITLIISIFMNIIDLIFFYSVAVIISKGDVGGHGIFGFKDIYLEIETVAVTCFVLRIFLHLIVIFKINDISTKACSLQRSLSLQSIFDAVSWKIHEINLGRFIDHYTRQYWILSNALLPGILRFLSDIMFVLILIIYFFIENRSLLLSALLVTIITASIIIFIQKHLRNGGLALDKRSKDFFNLIDVLHKAHGGIVASRSPNYILDKLIKTEHKIINAMRNTMTISAFPKLYIEVLIFGLALFVTMKSNFNDNIFELDQDIGIMVLASIRLVPIAINMSNIIGNLNLYGNLIEEIHEFDLSIKKMKKDKYNTLNSTMVVHDVHQELSLTISNFRIPFIVNFNNGIPLSLNLSAGDFMHIRGRSGSGKSTLLKCIAGLDERNSGDIIFLDGGKQILASDCVDYVTQTPFLINAPLLENIILQDRKTIDSEKLQTIIIKTRELLIDLNLEKFCIELAQEPNSNFELSSLSGGEMQRVHLARSLFDPKGIILFDEPTSSVDGKVEQIIIDAIEKYAPKSIKLFVTHNTTLVRANHKVIKI